MNIIVAVTKHLSLGSVRLVKWLCDYSAIVRMTEVILYFADIVNVSRRKVWSSQSLVELGTPCSCMGCPVVRISLCEITLLFVCELFYVRFP